MNKQFINQLKERLKKPLPGKKAQSIMMVKSKTPFQVTNELNTIKHSSVLILLFFKDNCWNFFLTKRTQHVNHHKGQISLPGGVHEGNESLQETAFRETEEEIGIPSKDINLIGELTPFYVPISNFKIFPFIGWLKIKPEIKIEIKEVEKIFSISLDEFILESTQKSKKDILHNNVVTIPYYNINNEIVWGATSVILSEFKQLILEIR
tara:strand:+ start:326 stop:949 length:624 start_codon:yes stop_codon:yes gene_type:complete